MHNRNTSLIYTLMSSSAVVSPNPKRSIHPTLQKQRPEGGRQYIVRECSQQQLQQGGMEPGTPTPFHPTQTLSLYYIPIRLHKHTARCSESFTVRQLIAFFFTQRENC